MASLKEKIKSSATLKSITMWLMQSPNDYRPRWWIRTFVNPIVHKRNRKSIIRWTARLDTFPYNRFDLGARSILESQTLVSNAVGDVIIGDKVLVGIGSKIIGPVTFGNNILIAQNVLMSALNHDFDDITTPIVNQGFSTKPIIIEDGAWIGGGAIITAGVKIGKNAVVGAGSVVTKDVAAYTLVVGNPARAVKEYDFFSKKWVRISSSSEILA
jgi:acetyltransferase-like isoleucine patch superfamily enzyme